MTGTYKEKRKKKISKICQNNYDRYWCLGIDVSPKAISYKNFKMTISLENIRHKIALTRFSLIIIF